MNKSDIVILTNYGDVHAAAVAWALSKIGEQPKIWIGREFPVMQKASMKIGESGLTEFSVESETGTIVRHDAIKTVWNRRPSNPVLSTQLHMADVPSAQRECDRFFQALTFELSVDVFWVNPRDHALNANHKPHQLIKAVESGLTIPDTLFTNDPALIREFYHKHGGDIIYKAFIQPHWRSEEKNSTRTFFTTPLPKSALEAEFSLRNVPGIYQPRIEKSFEVRLTMMGEHAFAVKIDSQSQGLASMDWRQDIVLNCKLSAFDMPDSVLKQCHLLMGKLGLVFGCIDMIVTNDNQYIFLEVNQMGQFLWLEDQVPELRLLETFAMFLASASTSFLPHHPSKDITFNDFLKSEEYTKFRRIADTSKRAQNLAVAE